MTTPTTAKRNTAAKKDSETPVSETPVVENSVNEEAQPEPVADDIPVNRIPQALSENSILADFCQRYLNSLDEIATYNKQVLADRDNEWTPTKLIAKAKELGSPEDASKAVPEIKSLLDDFEKALTLFNVARKAVVEGTAKELGITLSVTAERDPAIEESLKTKRAEAKIIGTQLSTIAEMTTDKSAKDSVLEFLSKNPLPAIGRDQTHSFNSGDSGTTTPKYRVHVSVFNKDGVELVSEDGFTKAGLALTKHYERGQAIKSDKLREVWEAAGNSKSDPYKVSPVEFTDNNLKFVLSKK